MFNFEDLLTAGGDVVQGFFGIDPNTKDSILSQVGTAAGNILGFDPESEDSFAAQVGQALGGIIGLGGSPGGILSGGGSSGLLGGGGIGGLLAAGVPAYYLGKAAMEEAKNQTGVPLIPLTQESGAGRYNIEAEIRRRMGLPAPNPVEFGMLPTGTLPQLSGGRARGPGGGGTAFEFASRTVPNLERPTPSAGDMRRDIPRGSEISLPYIHRERARERDRYDIPAPPPPVPDMPRPDFFYSRGTTVFDQYDPATDSFIGTAGGVAGSMPIKIPRSEASSFFPGLIEAYKESQGGASNRTQPTDPRARMSDKLSTFLRGRQQLVRGFRSGGIVSLAEGGDVETEDGEMMDADEFERMNGDINGEGTEVSDDVPAMLSDGEFVMTGQAVRGAGSYDLDVGEGGIITLTPGGEESRDRGTDLMYRMMELFSEYASEPEED
jgi:hypothetical protein